MKIEQRAALEAFVAGKGVFAMLPTGFSKSLIYQLAALVAKSIGLCEDAVVVDISPLITPIRFSNINIKWPTPATLMFTSQVRQKSFNAISI